MSHKMISFGLGALLSVAHMTTAVSAEKLTGAELKGFVNGKRIHLATPFGGEFPLNYKKSGIVSGDGTSLGLGKFLAPKEDGRWWVKGENLCQQFPTWYDGKATCFRIERTGDKSLNWIRDDGRRGKARVEG